jgi:hypothetical protein
VDDAAPPAQRKIPRSAPAAAPAAATAQALEHIRALNPQHGDALLEKSCKPSARRPPSCRRWRKPSSKTRSPAQAGAQPQIRQRHGRRPAAARNWNNWPASKQRQRRPLLAIMERHSRPRGRRWSDPGKGT